MSLLLKLTGLIAGAALTANLWVQAPPVRRPHSPVNYSFVQSSNMPLLTSGPPPTADISYVNSTAQGAAGVTSINPGKPVGVVATDILIASVISPDSTYDQTVPSGWTYVTSLAEEGTTVPRVTIFWALGSVSTTNFTSVSASYTVVIDAYRGVDNVTPIGALSTTSSGGVNSTTVTALSITATVNKAWAHVTLGVTGTVSTISGTPDCTLRNTDFGYYDTGDVGPLTLGNPSGNVTDSVFPADTYVGIQVELRPATLGGSNTPLTANLWPNPQPRRIGSGYTQSSDIALLSGTVAAPFDQIDWPNPRTQPRTTGFTQSSDLGLLLVPFGQTDWPNPQQQRRVPERTSSVNLELLGQDQFFGVAGQPPANYDWPVPKGYVPSITLRTWVEATKLNLIGQDAVYNGAGKGVPYYEWPVPAGRQFPVELRTFVGSINSNLFTPVVAPPAPNTDWPVPKGKEYPSGLRTFVAPINLNLVGQDQLFGAAGQPLANYDWPVPKGKIPSVDLRTWTDSHNTNTLFGQDRFFGANGEPVPNYDWPVPKSKIPATSLKTWTDNVRVNLIGQDQFFGSAGEPVPNYDWPVPKGRQYPIDLRTYILSTDLDLLGLDQFEGAPGEPLPNYDWPVPKGYVPSIALRTWIDPLKLNLIGQDRFFGANGEPVANYDWPVPKGRQYPSDLRTFTNSVNLNLLGQDKFYGAPGEIPPLYEWPVPKGYVPGIALKTWIDPVKINLIGQDRFYGASGEAAPNYDWPVPSKHYAQTVTRTHAAIQSESNVYSDRLTNLLLGKDQFFGAPGQPVAFEPPPNPIGKPYPHSLRYNDPQRANVLPVTGDQTVLPTGIPTQEALGTPKIVMYLKPTGIGSQEAVGTPTVLYGLLVLPSGIASQEAVGTPKINFTAHPSGIVSSEAFGTPKVNFIIKPSGIASAGAVGTPHVYLAVLQTVQVSGIASAQAVGTPQVIYRQFINPTGIISASAVGTPRMKQTGLSLSHLALAMNALYLCKIRFGINTDRIALATLALSEIALALSFASPDDPIDLLYNIQKDVKLALECMFDRGFGSGEKTLTYVLETERIHIERAYQKSHDYLFTIGFIKS